MFYKKEFPLQHQHDYRDCGPACLQMIAAYHGSKITFSQVKEKVFIGKDGSSLLALAEAARSIGFEAEGLIATCEGIKGVIELPCIIHWDANHYVVLYKIKNSLYYIADPRGGLLRYRESEFLDHWLRGEVELNQGVVLSLDPTDSLLNYNNKESKNGIKILLDYCLKFKKQIAMLCVSLLLASGIQLILPFFTQAIIDQGIRKNDISIIYLLIIGQIFLFIGEIGNELTRRWMLIILSAKVNLTIISEFLSKLMRLPLSFFDNKVIGDILQRVEDHSRIERFLSSSTLNVLFSTFNLFVFCIVLLYYSAKVLITFLIFSALYIVYISLFMNKRKELDLKRFNQLKVNSNYLLEIIIGMFEIKLNNSERKKVSKWRENQVNIFQIQQDSGIIQQYQEAGGILINQVKNIAITFLAAISVMNGEMTLGMMLAILFIVGQLNQPVLSILNFARDLQDAKLSMERVSEVEELADEEKPEDLSIEGQENKSIQVSGLHFQYEGIHSPYALKNININIPAGKITAIVGGSGSGKTTLLKLLLKFYTPTEGTIQVGNNDLRELSTSSWRKKCGIVLQDGFLFSDTIEDNINMFDDQADPAKMEAALRLSNSDEFVSTLVKKEGSMVGMDGSGLSHGQKQRILIARSIYKNPEYFFLDEATSALDAFNESIIHNNLLEVFKNKTVLIIAHRLSTVKNADQIIVMHKGEIVESGKHSELIQNKSYYFNLVKNQLELGS